MDINTNKNTESKQTTQTKYVNMLQAKRFDQTKTIISDTERKKKERVKVKYIKTIKKFKLNVHVLHLWHAFDNHNQSF